MDEETKAQFDEVSAALESISTTLSGTATMAPMNAGFERLLDQISTLQTDFQNTKGFLLEDAIVMGRRSLSLEDRLSQLERKQP